LKPEYRRVIDAPWGDQAVDRCNMGLWGSEAWGFDLRAMNPEAGHNFSAAAERQSGQFDRKGN